MTADWLAAISSALSAFAAIGAFIYALRMRREDSINGVRPELLLLDWSVEGDGINSDAIVRAAMIRNVGRGPAFDIFVRLVDPTEPDPEILGGMLICPYLAPGADEPTLAAFAVKVGDRPDERLRRPIIIQLVYTDLGGRRHSVRLHLVVAMKPGSTFQGTKELATGLFMITREPTIIEREPAGPVRRWAYRLLSRRRSG